MNRDITDAVLSDMELLYSDSTFNNDYLLRNHSNPQISGCQNARCNMRAEFTKDDMETIVSCSIDLMEGTNPRSSADSQLSRKMTLVTTNTAASSDDNLYNIRNDWSYPVNTQHVFFSGETMQCPNRLVTVKEEDEGRIGCHLAHSGFVEQYHAVPDESKIVPLETKAKGCQNVICAKDDVFIPVNLLKLLKDVEDDEDGIKAFLESEETRPTEKDIKVFKTSQNKIHPSYAGIKCQVCGGQAVGFHYGADVCAGCRLFFYRYRKRTPKHKCTRKNGKKVVMCLACRLEKCKNAGMNIEASKRGRCSYHRQYEYAMRKVNDEVNKKIPPQIVYMAHEMMNLASRITEMFLSCVRHAPHYYENIPMKTEQYLKSIKTLKSRHLEMNLEGFKEVHRKRNSQGRILLKSYHAFLKQVPGYKRLNPEDQNALFMGGSIWSLFIISEYRAYDVENGLEYHHDGRVTTREEMECYVGSGYAELLFNIVAKLQKLNLHENERNLLKLAGFFETKDNVSEEGNLVATQEQDAMIRAFDHVVRANRPNSAQATVVIGNAMQVLADMHDFRRESAKEFDNNLNKYPPDVSEWLMKTFVAAQSQNI